MFLAKMRAARFVAGQRIQTHQFGEFQKVRHPARAFERLVEVFPIARDADLAPEFFAQLWNFLERFFQAGFVSRHSAFVPKKRPKLSMDRVERTLSVYL